MEVRPSPSGSLLRVRDLVFVGSTVLEQDVGTSGPGLPLEPVPGGLAFNLPGVRVGQAIRFSACIVCSNDTPGGLTFFQIRVGGSPDGALLGRETGIRDNGAVALEWFGEVPDEPIPPGPILCEIMWRSVGGTGAIRAAGPTDGEGASFSVAIWDRG